MITIKITGFKTIPALQNIIPLFDRKHHRKGLLKVNLGNARESKFCAKNGVMCGSIVRKQSFLCKNLSYVWNLKVILSIIHTQLSFLHFFTIVDKAG